MEKFIYSTSLNSEDFERIKKMFYNQKSKGVSPADIDFLNSASEKSVPVNLNDHPFIVYTIKKGNVIFKAIDVLLNAEITPMEPVIDAMDDTLLKATIYGENMCPTLCPGDVGLFQKVEDKSFIPWGEIFLIEDEDRGNIVCRINKSEDPGKVKISYDGREVKQDFPLRLLDSLWELKTFQRVLSA